MTDFALVPDAEVCRRVHEGVTLRWDLTALRQLRYVDWEILLTTPATGRLPLDYYHGHWLPDNPRRHSVPARPPPDHLHQTVVIDDVTVPDGGLYVIEVILTSSVHRWLNSSWQFSTRLMVESMRPVGQPAAVITLAVLLALTSVVVAVLLVRAVCRR